MFLIQWLIMSFNVFLFCPIFPENWELDLELDYIQVLCFGGDGGQNFIGDAVYFHLCHIGMNVTPGSSSLGLWVQMVSTGSLNSPSTFNLTASAAIGDCHLELLFCQDFHTGEIPILSFLLHYSLCFLHKELSYSKYLVAVRYKPRGSRITTWFLFFRYQFSEWWLSVLVTSKVTLEVIPIVAVVCVCV